MVLILLQKGFYQALQEPKGKPCFPQRALGGHAGLSRRLSPPACMGEAGPASTVFFRETRACAFYSLCSVSSPVLNILCVCFRNTLKHTLICPDRAHSPVPAGKPCRSAEGAATPARTSAPRMRVKEIAAPSQDCQPAASSNC